MDVLRMLLSNRYVIHREPSSPRRSTRVAPEPTYPSFLAALAAFPADAVSAAPSDSSPPDNQLIICLTK
jgi:hypothetical protein